MEQTSAVKMKELFASTITMHSMFPDHCFVFVYRVARIFSRWEGGVVLWLANLNFRNIDFSL